MWEKLMNWWWISVRTRTPRWHRWTFRERILRWWYKYPDVHLNNKLDWTHNTQPVYKKGKSRLYLLRKMRSFGVQGYSHYRDFGIWQLYFLLVLQTQLQNVPMVAKWIFIFVVEVVSNSRFCCNWPTHTTPDPSTSSYYLTQISYDSAVERLFI